MKFRVEYTVSHRVLVDISPEEYLKIRKDDTAILKKAGAPKFRSVLIESDLNSYDDALEFFEYCKQEK